MIARNFFRVEISFLNRRFFLLYAKFTSLRIRKTFLKTLLCAYVSYKGKLLMKKMRHRVSFWAPRSIKLGNRSKFKIKV
jgi:hypothetical protein